MKFVVVILIGIVFKKWIDIDDDDENEEESDGDIRNRCERIKLRPYGPSGESKI